MCRYRRYIEVKNTNVDWLQMLLYFIKTKSKTKQMFLSGFSDIFCNFFVGGIYGVLTPKHPAVTILYVVSIRHVRRLRAHGVLKPNPVDPIVNWLHRFVPVAPNSPTPVFFAWFFFVLNIVVWRVAFCRLWNLCRS